MLVLTRKEGEEIVIGDNIRIQVVAIGPGRVKIGFVAPDGVEINRAEIFEKKRAERLAAADVTVQGPAVADAPTVVNRIAGKFPPPQPLPRKPR